MLFPAADTVDFATVASSFGEVLDEIVVADDGVLAEVVLFHVFFSFYLLIQR